MRSVRSLFKQNPVDRKSEKNSFTHMEPEPEMVNKNVTAEQIASMLQKKREYEQLDLVASRDPKQSEDAKAVCSSLIKIEGCTEQFSAALAALCSQQIKLESLLAQLQESQLRSTSSVENRQQKSPEASDIIEQLKRLIRDSDRMAGKEEVVSALKCIVEGKPRTKATGGRECAEKAKRLHPDRPFFRKKQSDAEESDSFGKDLKFRRPSNTESAKVLETNEDLPNNPSDSERLAHCSQSLREREPEPEPLRSRSRIEVAEASKPRPQTSAANPRAANHRNKKTVNLAQCLPPKRSASEGGLEQKAKKKSTVLFTSGPPKRADPKYQNSLIFEAIDQRHSTFKSQNLPTVSNVPERKLAVHSAVDPKSFARAPKSPNDGLGVHAPKRKFFTTIKEKTKPTNEIIEI